MLCRRSLRRMCVIGAGAAWRSPPSGRSSRSWGLIARGMSESLRPRGAASDGAQIDRTEQDIPASGSSFHPWL